MTKTKWIKLPAVALALVLALAPVAPGRTSPLDLAANAIDWDNMPDAERLERAKGASNAPIVLSGSGASAASSAYPHKNLKSYIAKAAETSKDVKGWLVVPSTNISKPIVQSAQNNTYYAHRTLGGVDYPGLNYKNFIETATYLDYRVKFGETWKSSSRNTVIYGHNWTNLREPLAVGSNNSHIMFGQLPSYTSIDFIRANPNIYFSTDKNEGIWRVFCVAYVELSPHFNYNAPNLSQDDFELLIKDLKQRSLFNFDVDVEKTDRILTLSTCTRQYNVGAQQRFIVVARLLRGGETEKDTVNVTVNANPKKPQF